MLFGSLQNSMVHPEGCTRACSCPASYTSHRARSLACFFRRLRVNRSYGMACLYDVIPHTSILECEHIAAHTCERDAYIWMRLSQGQIPARTYCLLTYRTNVAKPAYTRTRPSLKTFHFLTSDQIIAHSAYIERNRTCACFSFQRV